MGVDVANVTRGDAGIGEGELDGAARTDAARGGCGDVVGVGGRGRPLDVGVDVRATCSSMLGILEHEHRGTFGHHEPVSVTIERSRDPLLRQCGHVGEASCRRGRDRCLGTAREGHVEAPHRDQVRSVGDGVVPGRARRRDGLARTVETEAHRDRRGVGVGHEERDEERRDAVVAALLRHDDLVLEALEPADAGPHDHTGARRIDRWRSGVVPCHLRCGDAELVVAIVAADLLRPEPGRRIPSFDAPHTRACWCKEALPEGLLADAHSAHDADARDGDAPRREPFGLGCLNSHESFP